MSWHTKPAEATAAVLRKERLVVMLVVFEILNQASYGLCCIDAMKVIKFLVQVPPQYFSQRNDCKIKQHIADVLFL